MTKEEATRELTYKDAGVDITAGNQLVEQIKPAVKSTYRTGVLGNIGGFGGMFELPWHKYRAPVLVSGTDGVGTKLRLAIDANNHSTIGIDLVAMCVNDIVVTGAEPLFFLDYFATGKLDVTQGTAIIEGIAAGCRQAGAALVGGESAEMPGLYHDGDYDLAGFSVGLVEKDQIIDGSTLQPGDIIIALGSSGPHSNGFSLIRSVLDASDSQLDSVFNVNGATLADALLEPTRIYVKSLLQIIRDNITVKAMAHITGGGLTENIPRALPSGLKANIHTDSWSLPAIFEWLKDAGNISTEEMHRVFNCGVGMVLVVPANQSTRALSILEQCGETAWPVGEIARSTTDAPASVVIA